MFPDGLGERPYVCSLGDEEVVGVGANYAPRRHRQVGETRGEVGSIVAFRDGCVDSGICCSAGRRLPRWQSAALRHPWTAQPQEGQGPVI
jgi:hypothetical protein